jgi:sirohydrochlorin ferrochelatase
MNGIEKKIVKQSISGQQLILCENLGYHKFVRDVLVERVNELLEKEQISQPI